MREVQDEVFGWAWMGCKCIVVFWLAIFSRGVTRFFGSDCRFAVGGER